MEIQERVQARVGWYRGRRQRQEAEYGSSRTIDVIHASSQSRPRSLSTATPFLRHEQYRLVATSTLAVDDDDGALERAGGGRVSIHSTPIIGIVEETHVHRSELH